MKKISVLLLSLLLCACTTLSELPKPELAEGIRGSQFGIDKNINEATIDNYLGRSDSVYIDCRMLKDEADYEAIGGDSYLSGYVKGFEVVPYPYLCIVIGLPPEVGNTYSGTTLFTQNEDGTYEANYEESDDVLEALFPKDKVIFLTCGGGGYAGMAKNLLIARGYDPERIYNTGGFWFYEGKNAISTVKDDGTYDFSGLSYHEINFRSLTPVEGYDPSKTDVDVDPRPSDTNIITLNELGEIDETGPYAVSVYLPGCSSCVAFKPVLEEFAASKQIPVYEISLDEVRFEEDFKDISFTPSLVLFKDGERLAFLDAGSDEDIEYYTDCEKLSTWIAEYLGTEIVTGTAVNNDMNCDDNACSY